MKEPVVIPVRLADGQAISLFVAGPKAALSRGLGNWSLRPFQRSGDEHRAPQLACALEAVFWGLGTERVYAPRVADASANVVLASALTDRIALRGSVLYRNQSLPADGVILASGDAFAMSAAGCAIIVAGDGKHYIVAHAGRDSLVDPAVVDGGARRTHMSVVDAIVDKFRRLGSKPENVTTVMMLAIPREQFAHPLNHPIYGERNRKLQAFVNSLWPSGMSEVNGVVCLSMETVFIQQAWRCGIHRAAIEYSLGKFHTLAHTRDGADPSRRNLIVVRCE